MPWTNLKFKKFCERLHRNNRPHFWKYYNFHFSTITKIFAVKLF